MARRLLRSSLFVVWVHEIRAGLVGSSCDLVRGIFLRRVNSHAICMYMRLSCFFSTCWNCFAPVCFSSPSQCVIIESRAAQEVEGGMEAVNDFVKTAPTFIAKVQVIFRFDLVFPVECGTALVMTYSDSYKGSPFFCTAISRSSDPSSHAARPSPTPVALAHGQMTLARGITAVPVGL